MVGSNNEVAVLEAVLTSLAKSPAFSLLTESALEEDTLVSESAAA